MARARKQVVKSVDTVTVFLTRPGRMDVLRPGMSMETENLPTGRGDAIPKDDRIDESRIGMKWTVGIPKLVIIAKPGSDGLMESERHALPQMEEEFTFTIGSEVSCDLVPAKVLEQLETLARQNQIVLKYGKMDLPTTEEVETVEESTTEGEEG